MENRITFWFLLRKVMQPKIRKLETNTEKVIKLVSGKNANKNLLIENCEIFRHSETDLALEKELSDYVAVSYYKDNFYFDKFSKYAILENNSVTVNSTKVIVNIYNTYLKINNLAIYKNCIVKKKIENTWEYFEKKEYLLNNIHQIISYFQNNFIFYLEYIDVKKLMLSDYTEVLAIVANASYYLYTIDIIFGVECKDGYFTDKFNHKDNTNFLVYSNKEHKKITEEERIMLLENAKKLKGELDVIK